MAAVTLNDINTDIRKGKLDAYFVEALNWELPDAYEPYPITIPKPGEPEAPADAYVLTPVVEKRGIVLFACSPNEDGQIPGGTTRRAIDKKLTDYAHEHLIVFHDDTWQLQIWQYTDREPGKPLRPRRIELYPGQSGEHLRQFLDRLHFDIEADETDITLIDVLDRIRSGIPADTVTKRFYTSFSKERDVFESFIEGIAAEGDRKWYASIMLNRLMFIWFVQAKGFLDNDPDYLINRFNQVTQGEAGSDTAFISFYRAFLRKLFDDGFDTPIAARSEAVRDLIGEVPYLNGGIFDRNAIEQSNEIDIPDETFARLFDFFGQYQWYLDDRPLSKGNEINPDVIGYIFEKFINQKEKGAYYTKEDVTGYISQNTIIPSILDQARRDCAIAFRPDAADNVWTLLKNDPDRYIYDSMTHGVIDADGNVMSLPADIAPGIDEVAQRGFWNTRAAEPYALPAETWREYVHRRQRTLELRDRLRKGEVHEVDDLITFNLDICQFAQDIVEQFEDPALLRAMYKAISNITVLDPTCGSGAFLFAALQILHPLQDACLQKMAELVADLPSTADAKKMHDFRDYLNQMRQHPNQDYFILRQIVLNNLYGVDIEQEAVEICKIRLFLKLVAQLDKVSEIEPLPDIDFNIRAGNTLVGFATEKEIQIASGSGQMAMDLDQTVSRITERAELADRAYQHFKRVQLDDEAAMADLPTAKAEYRRRLGELRDELDRYLHRQQAPGERRDIWKVRANPFHWFVEFHNVVIDRGGFDAIIGNPPYVRASTIRKQYQIAGYKTVSCPDIYAMVMERSADLVNRRGRLGMIVPLSIEFSADFAPLRKIITASGSQWFSSFDNIPAALFTGVSQRCTIVLMSPNASQLFTSQLRRWRAEFRALSARSMGHLTQTLAPTPLRKIPGNGKPIPMLTSSRLEPLFDHIDAANALYQPSLDNQRVGLSPTARNFISAYLIEPPLVDPNSLAIDSTTSSVWMNTSSTALRLSLFGVLVSPLGFWYWLVAGDGFHVTKGVMSRLLNACGSLDQQTLEALASVGFHLHAQRAQYLVFKKNSGKYVGNYNYSAARALTDRVVMLFTLGAGFTDAIAQELLDTVDRVLSINEHAGEKGIPASIHLAAVESLRQQPMPSFDALSIEDIDEHIQRLTATPDKRVASR